MSEQILKQSLQPEMPLSLVEASRTVRPEGALQSAPSIRETVVFGEVGEGDAVNLRDVLRAGMNDPRVRPARREVLLLDSKGGMSYVVTNGSDQYREYALKGPAPDERVAGVREWHESDVSGSPVAPDTQMYVRDSRVRPVTGTSQSGGEEADAAFGLLDHVRSRAMSYEHKRQHEERARSLTGRLLHLVGMR